MYARYRSQSFVLKKEDKGEVDELFTIYTKEFGKLEVLGKGIKKIKSKLRASIDLFYLSEIEFIQGKTYKTLTDAILIEKFKNIRKSLIRVKAIYSISEILDRVIGGQEKDERVWNLLTEVFFKLNSPKIKNPFFKLIFYYFLWNLLSILGYRPELLFCAICRGGLKQKELYFSSKDGGLICLKCQKKKPLTKKIEPETVKILRLLIEKNWQILERLKIENRYLKELEFISKNYFSFIFGQP